MTLTDLPEIRITKNMRSKRLRLRVNADTIQITAPWFCTDQQIQNFIQESESWILKTWHAQQQRLAQIDRTLPQELNLFNRDQALQIKYVQQRANYQLDDLNHVLRISDRQAERYLKVFVIEYAQQHLPLYLAEVSQRCGLVYQACNIRQPKTRWGSCSAKHDIMLNSSLVLFPKHVVHYLCVHELAHTRHFDHSAQFWAEVAKHDPDFQVHRKHLKNTPLPYWWNNH